MIGNRRRILLQARTKPSCARRYRSCRPRRSGPDQRPRRRPRRRQQRQGPPQQQSPGQPDVQRRRTRRLFSSTNSSSFSTAARKSPRTFTSSTWCAAASLLSVESRKDRHRSLLSQTLLRRHQITGTAVSPSHSGCWNQRPDRSSQGGVKAHNHPPRGENRQFRNPGGLTTCAKGAACSCRLANLPTPPGPSAQVFFNGDQHEWYAGLARACPELQEADIHPSGAGSSPFLSWSHHHITCRLACNAANVLRCRGKDLTCVPWRGVVSARRSARAP